MCFVAIGSLPLILMADENAKISAFAPLWRSYHIFTYSVGVVVGV